MVEENIRIIESDDVNLRLISEATETQSPKSEVSIEGTRIKLTVSGVDVEACIAYEKSYLIFTTNGNPFEETLNIYLLSIDNEVVDSVTVCWPYSTGSFKLLGIVYPDLVRFSFFGDKVWEVEIYRNKRFHIPYVLEPSGVWRKVRFWRSFGISEVSSSGR